MTNINIDEMFAMLNNIKQTGSGHTARCPAHDDKTNSLSIKSDSGKILLFCHAGCSFEAITTALGIEAKQLMGESDTKPKFTVSKEYNYTDESGNLLYQVVRVVPKSFRQRQPGTDGKWIWNLKGIKPTLYKLPDLIKAIDAKKTVCIVEGEKDVLSLEKLGITATCNSGGAGKWPKNESKRFKGAKVVIIPDNDEPGIEHGEAVATLISKHASEVRIVHLPDSKKSGDVTDWITAGGSKAALVRIVMATPLWKPTKPAEKTKTDTKPLQYLFRFLGYNDGHHYYMPHEDLQIVHLSPDQHTQAALINLAPLQWWETNFPTKSGIDWNAARNALYRKSKQMGIYDTRRLRGCGAWFDEGRVVQHNGDRLIVDGIPTAIEEFKTKNIYNASFPIEVEKSNSASNTTAAKLLEICRMPAWGKPISGTLLAGWIVVAPICGALSWRPHIWMTGSSGTGKTWISENIIKPSVGNLAFNAQSNTTEAGIRQGLGINAYPVILDEAEAEDQRARARLQGIIELMRQASSETGAPIVKGTSGGRAMLFHIRSCFMLSSVGVNVTQKADTSRITVLSLTKSHPRDAEDLFDELKTLTLDTVTKPWAASIRARSLELLPVILENAEIFGRVIAHKFTDQRIGDQYGALLAGAFSLTSGNVVTDKNAEKWVDKQDWTQQSAIENMTDERRCLNYILEHIVRYSSDMGNGLIEKSVSDLLYKQPMLSVHVQTLERIGIRVIEVNSRDPIIVFSDSHQSIKKILMGSPWEKNWALILKRLPGSNAKSGFRFNEIIHRSTAIPHKTIFDPDINLNRRSE